MNLQKNISLFSLLAANLFLLVIYLFGQVSFISLLWVYWFQSLIIGFFNVVRIFSAKEISMKGIRSGEKEVNYFVGLNIIMGIFFMIHYGIFHVVYAGFLVIGPLFGELFLGGVGALSLGYIFLGTLAFLVNHGISYVQHKHEEKKPSALRLMFFPYLRIVPMHLILILGIFFFKTSGVVFILLKMLIDVLMHRYEHKKDFSPRT